MKKVFIVLLLTLGAASTYIGWSYFSFENLKSQCLSKIISHAATVPSNILLVHFEKGSIVSLIKIEELENYILDIAGVSSAGTITAGELLERFKRQHITDPLFLALGKPDQDPSQPLVEVYVGDGAEIGKIKQEVTRQAISLGLPVYNIFSEPTEQVIVDLSKDLNKKLDSSLKGAVSNLKFKFPFLSNSESFSVVRNCAGSVNSVAARKVILKLLRFIN